MSEPTIPDYLNWLDDLVRKHGIESDYLAIGQLRTHIGRLEKIVAYLRPVEPRSMTPAGTEAVHGYVSMRELALIHQIRNELRSGMNAQEASR